jgi:hypothetical protein
MSCYANDDDDDDGDGGGGNGGGDKNICRLLDNIVKRRHETKHTSQASDMQGT